MKAGLVAINVAAVIFGCSGLFAKLPVSTVYLVAGRAFFAATTLLLVGKCTGKEVILSSPARCAVLSSGLILAAHWFTFFASVKLAGVAVATLTFAAFPLFTVLVEAKAAGRFPGAWELSAGGAILIAVALLVGESGGKGRFLGVLSGFVSALTFAFFGLLSKGITRTAAPLPVSLAQNAVVFCVFLPFLPFASPAPASSTEWLCLGALGAITTVLMHQLYLFALSRLAASTCAGFVALEPVYAILFAALFFGDPITLWIGVSAVLIVGASLTLLRLESKLRVR